MSCEKNWNKLDYTEEERQAFLERLLPFMIDEEKHKRRKRLSCSQKRERQRKRSKELNYG